MTDRKPTHRDAANDNYPYDLDMEIDFAKGIPTPRAHAMKILLVLIAILASIFFLAQIARLSIDMVRSVEIMLEEGAGPDGIAEQLP